MTTNHISNTSLLITRAILATVIAGHGAQKLLGWFGGFGFDGTMGYFTGTIGLPYIFALLIILAESFGMIALLLGLGSRLFAAALIPIMLGAIFTTHKDYFFMNWFGAQGGEGYEFHLLVVALALLVTINGGGAYSLDNYIRRKLALKKSLATLLVG